jgi:steroid 5-alpha reductase family enzyme
MQETPYAAPPGTVAVTKPVAVRQVAAGLVTVAAAMAASGLALSLTTVEWGPGDFGSGHTVTQQAWGEQVVGSDTENWADASLMWGGPLVVAVVLLIAAGVAALVASRTDRRDGWARVAQLLAVAGASATAGVVAVLVAFGAAMVSVDNYDNPGGRIDTFWGPAPFVLGLAAVLAAAAAAMVRRGRAGVLAVVEVRS